MSAVAARWRGTTAQQVAIVVLSLPIFVLAGGEVAVLIARFGAGKVAWVLAIMVGGIWAMGNSRRTAAVLAVALAFPFRTKLFFGREVHTTHLLLVAIAAVGAAELALRRRRAPPGFLAPVVVIAAGAAIASLAGPLPGPSLLRTAWGVALPLLAAVTLATTLHSGRELRGIVIALGVGVAGESLIAMAQAVGKAPGIFPAWEADRAVGLFLHPNILGSFLATSMLISAGVATVAWRSSPLTAAGLVGVVMLGLAGLVVTESRGALIGLIAGTVVLSVLMLVSRQAIAALSMFAIIGLALAVAVPRLPEPERAAFGKRLEQLTRPGAEAGRERIYKEARNVIARYPFTGVGPLTFGKIGSQRSKVSGIECCLTHAHNVALEAYLSIGPLGLAGLLWLCGGSIRRLLRLRHRRDDPFVAGWAIGGLGAIVSLVVGGMFDFVFWQLEMFVLLLLILVSGYALVAVAEGPARPPSR
jgi:O-antigen ligase